MPSGIYKNKECPSTIIPIFSPNLHQIAVRDYFKNSLYKGILLYHKLGSGKTCTAIITADALLRENLIKHVYILTPGSLRTNWLFEYCNTCGIGSDNLNTNYTFITYNYSISDQLENENFENSLVIIDEFHMVINGVKNGTKTFTDIYNKIMESRCKIMLLSGTPIIKNPEEEWEIILKLLDPDRVVPTNEDQMLELQQGLVSYFESDDQLYPQIFYKDPIKTNMTPEQVVSFVKIYKREIITQSKGAPKPENYPDTNEYKLKKAMYILAMKFFLSKRVSNFYYPKNIAKNPDILATEKTDEVPSIELQKEAEKELKEIMENDPLTQGVELPKPRPLSGWVDKETLSNKKLMTVYSPKFTSVITNILLNLGTKHLIYSIFKIKGGVVLLNTLLNKCGIKTAIFSGDLNDSERLRLLKRYNSPENKNGEIITVLLITEAGEQGITLLEVNNVHILESSRNSYKTQQAIGRAARYKSHVNLPPERNFVNVWRYWSMVNDKNGIDEILFNRAKESQDVIDKFNEGLQKISISHE
jgi:hypothetical protein|tara:strand:- start:915 stop:2507 length:1593 start_codon:yes stop_codon:yes gene_type:complete